MRNGVGKKQHGFDPGESSPDFDNSPETMCACGSGWPIPFFFGNPSPELPGLSPALTPDVIIALGESAGDEDDNSSDDISAAGDDSDGAPTNAANPGGFRL